MSLARRRPLARWATVAVVLCCAQVAGAMTPAGPARTRRLVALAQLAETIHFFHPALDSPDVAWSEAVAAAAPKVADARTRAQLEDAVTDLLAVLDDPATRCARAAEPHAPVLSLRTRDEQGVVVVSFEREPAEPRTKELARVRSAGRVVVDLRGTADSAPPGAVGRAAELADLPGWLCSRPVAGPWQHARTWSGFPPVQGRTSGGYAAEWSLVPPARVEPLREPTDAPRRLVVLVDAASDVPAFLLGLQREGLADFVGPSVPTDAGACRTWPIELPFGLRAFVRTSELVHPDGGTGVRLDAGIPEEGALEAAIGLAREDPEPRPPERRPADGRPQRLGQRQRSWASGPLPDLGHRLLAGFRTWSVIELFFPYRHLMGEDWTEAFRAALPRLEHARDAVSYGRAIAELLTHVHDSHAAVSSTALTDWLGTAYPTVGLRWIETPDGPAAVVARLAGDAADEDLAVGDVVQAIDGVPVTRRLEELRTVLSASTEQAFHRTALWRALGGADGSALTLRVVGASGEPRDVTLHRHQDAWQQLSDERTRPVAMRLPSGVGYVDLDRLERHQVLPALRALADAPAIVFDMRGYPRGTAWVLAPLLSDGSEPVAALFRRPRAASPDPQDREPLEFEQRVPPSNGERTLGRTVMLIDERTQSQAEHTGLFLRAANGTEFVGSPTAGANGDVTSFTLPGGLHVTFSGHDVRHADGAQLQRLGLQPDVPVRPTLAGIRAGRDEVLEVALRHLGVDPATDGEPVTLPGAQQAAPLPRSWQAGGTESDDYAITVEQDETQGTNVRLAAAVALPEGVVTIAQACRCEHLRGHRVRLSARVAGFDVAGRGGLWLRVDGEGRALAADDMERHPLRGTFEWTRHEVVADVPPTAEGLQYGALLTGPGELRVDDFALEIVSEGVTPTEPAREGPADAERARRQREWYAGTLDRPANLDFESGTK